MKRKVVLLTFSLILLLTGATVAYAKIESISLVHVGAITDDATTFATHAGPAGISVKGDYAYVASYVYNEGRIAVLDVSDRTNPTLATSFVDDNTTNFGGPFETDLVGNYLYIASYNDDALAIIDISDPNNPFQVGSVVNNNGPIVLNEATSVTVVGNYAYLTARWNNGLEIIDISDPANPVHAGSIVDDANTTLRHPYEVAVSGNYAYVASYADSAIEVVDISDPTNPTHVTSIVDNATMELAGAYGVTINGNYLYVASWDDNGVEILDISNPANPTHVGAISDDGSTELAGACDIIVNGNYAYIAAFDDDGVQILDISNPANPLPVFSITDDGTTELDGAYQLTTDGNFVYVSGFYDNGIEILQIKRVYTALPSTGFPHGHVTALPEQPATKAYTETEMTLEIPKLGINIPIVGVPLNNGNWDVSWLNQSAGYLAGSAFPTWAGNTVITAHVWDAWNQPGPFAELKTLGYGDQVQIHAWGQIFTYEIRESKLLKTKDVNKVLQSEEYDWLTLLTCEFYNPFTETYMFRRSVRAVLISVR